MSILFEIAFQNARFLQQMNSICFEFKKNDCVEYNDIVEDKYKQKIHKTKCLIKIDPYRSSINSYGILETQIC